jgi:hypothetical protein
MGELTHVSGGRTGAPVPCRTLAEYLREIVRRVGESDPAALERLRAVVGGRRARLTLDAERATVAFTRRGFVARNERGGAARPNAPRRAGEGATTRRATLALLDGWQEVSEAVVLGELEMRGSIEDVTRMGVAIEIVLDVAARSPALQRLAADYRADPCRQPAVPWDAHRRRGFERRMTESSEAELALLERLGLL